MEYEYGVRIKGSDKVYGIGPLSTAMAELAYWDQNIYSPVLVRRPKYVTWETF